MPGNKVVVFIEVAAELSEGALEAVAVEGYDYVLFNWCEFDRTTDPLKLQAMRAEVARLPDALAEDRDDVLQAIDRRLEVRDAAAQLG